MIVFLSSSVCFRVTFSAFLTLAGLLFRGCECVILNYHKKAPQTSGAFIDSWNVKIYGATGG